MANQLCLCEGKLSSIKINCMTYWPRLLGWERAVQQIVEADRIGPAVRGLGVTRKFSTVFCNSACFRACLQPQICCFAWVTLLLQLHFMVNFMSIRLM